MLEAGWDVFRTPLIDYKLGSGRVPRPEHGPRRQWEMCLYAIKGDKNVTGIFSDVIPASWKKTYHTVPTNQSSFTSISSSIHQAR
jgi:hypothetical protein